MTQQPPKPEKNIFMLEEIFPDAGGIFSSRFNKLEDSYEDALIVFDTNVLLLPYSLGNDSLGQLRDLYQTLVNNNRLFVPNRVAREFAKNRNKKLGDIHHSVLSQKKGKTKNLQYPILDNMDEKKALDEAFEKLEQAEREYYKAVTDLASTIKAWEWDDPVSSMYSDLFAESVLVDHEKADEELKAELKRRFKLQIPPGYKDANKDDGGVGDLSIWLSILKLGKDTKKDIIFVTEDVKPDWWNQSSGSEFLPRYELIDEFRRSSEGGTLHIVRLSKLLELFNVEVALVEEAKRAENRKKARLLTMIKKIEEHRAKKRKELQGLPKEAVIEEMKEWFYSNFEDPANSCPYDGREGGYQYIWGGPYDASEVLFEEYAGVVADAMIEEVATELNDSCWEWSGVPRNDEF